MHGGAPLQGRVARLGLWRVPDGTGGQVQTLLGSLTATWGVPEGDGDACCRVPCGSASQRANKQIRNTETAVTER